MTDCHPRKSVIHQIREAVQGRVSPGFASAVYYRSLINRVESDLAFGASLIRHAALISIVSCKKCKVCKTGSHAFAGYRENPCHVGVAKLN